jgi:hypothetical protein
VYERQNALLLSALSMERRCGSFYLVPIHKSENLVEIKAREKFNRRPMVDIPRIQFFAQHRYLPAFGRSGKLAI